VNFQLTLEFFEPADEETIVWISGEFKLELDVGNTFSLPKIGRKWGLFSLCSAER
jgi:hypothetical protein